MHDLLRRVRLVSVLPTPTGAAGGPVDFNATGDKFIYTPATIARCYRFGYITDAAQDPDAGGFVLALDHRPTAGSDTDRTEKATITRADAETTAAGKLVYADTILAVAQAAQGDGSLLDVGPSGPVEVRPGEQLVIEVTNAVGAASTGYVFLEVMELAFEKSDADVIVELS